MSEAKVKTCWPAADEATLVEAFAVQKRVGNMSENGWKASAYNAVVSALEGSEKVSGSAAKTLATVKSWWQRVCLSPHVYLHCPHCP